MEAVNESKSDKIVSHLVNEQWELVSLVFRLTWGSKYREYNGTKTKYERRINSTFNGLKEHPIVVYTEKNLKFGMDAIFKMAIHLEKTDNCFSLVDDLGFLVQKIAGVSRWTKENATEFVKLLNDFYLDSNFFEFFSEHIKFYEKHSSRFLNHIDGKISYEWFKRFGFDRKQMTVVLSPSAIHGGFGGETYNTTLNEKMIYAGLSHPTSRIYDWWFERSAIHEFVHAFADQIAEGWYAENEKFRKWCDSSVDLKKLPYYPSGRNLACEYITRAYTILYLVENNKDELSRLFRFERKNGFPYIEKVFALITEYTL